MMVHSTMLLKPRLCVVILSLLAVCSVINGCRSSGEATNPDEGFFEPLKSIDRPVVPKPSKAGDAVKSPAGGQRADSLLTSQKDQERRIGALSEQLQLLESSRRGARADSSKELKTPSAQLSKQDGLPASPAYEEVLQHYNAGRYKAAVEGFQELLRRGVSKDAEDQYHYMVGASHYHLRQFDLAAASLKRVVNWKGSKLKADAYFVLGQVYRQFGASRQAKSMFEAVLKESPRNDLAAAARQELKELASKK
ncbi:MAG: tetratricopeptide repeat protein [Ignavibacteria bacterium]|nr:tetratricopeptide repeat protein [Ignavibacteria bacterium]